MDIKKMVVSSVDFKYLVHQLLWFGISCILFAVLAIIPPSNDSNTLHIASIVLLIPLVPITIYYIVRIILLFTDLDHYKPYTAISKEVPPALLSLTRSCAFVLEIKDEDGNVFTAQSKQIFSTRSISSLYFGSYLNKPLQVLYHTKTGGVIVVGELL